MIDFLSLKFITFLLFISEKEEPYGDFYDKYEQICVNVLLFRIYSYLPLSESFCPLLEWFFEFDSNENILLSWSFGKLHLGLII